MNKLISWDTDKPLSVKTIVNGAGVVNTTDLRNQFLEAWIVDWLGWKYRKMVENLRNKV